MNVKYLLDEIKFNAEYLLNRTEPNETPLVGFAGNRVNNVDYQLIQKELIKQKIPFHEIGYRSPSSNISIFKMTKLWITSHGPFYIPDYNLYKLTHKRKAKWLDIWHGCGTLPFVGRAKMLKDYDAATVSSKFYKKELIKRDPSLEDKIYVTGLPRFDLLDPGGEPEKLVLYAPSWENPRVSVIKKKDPGLPRVLREICLECGYDFIYRPHINESGKRQQQMDLNRVAVLITDYSDIANDFAPLKRPTIFVDRGFKDRDFLIPLRKRGHLTSEFALQLVLHWILIGTWCPEFNSEHLNKICTYKDRKNTERVVNLIKEMIE